MATCFWIQGNLGKYRPVLVRKDSDWVVLGQPLAEAAKVTLDYKAPVAAAIMVLMVDNDGI